MQTVRVSVKTGSSPWQKCETPPHKPVFSEENGFVINTRGLLPQAGSDGVLHLRIPVGEPEAEYEAVVVLQPSRAGDARGAHESPRWPPRYFDETFESITNEAFDRPPQGELPKPVEFK